MYCTKCNCAILLYSFLTWYIHKQTLHILSLMVYDLMYNDRGYIVIKLTMHHRKRMRTKDMNTSNFINGGVVEYIDTNPLLFG
jgi:hypothetical protein